MKSETLLVRYIGPTSWTTPKVAFFVLVASVSSFVLGNWYDHLRYPLLAAMHPHCTVWTMEQ